MRTQVGLHRKEPRGYAPEPQRSRIRVLTPSRWALLLAPLVLGACGVEPPRHEPLPRPVRTMTLRSPQDVTTHTFSGRATAAGRSLLAFRVPGQVEAVLVDLGDRVKRGQVLARLDARDYRLKVQELEASLAAAEARLEQAQAGYERGRRLVSDEAISRAHFESLEALWKEAAGARDALSEGLATAGLGCRKTNSSRLFSDAGTCRRKACEEHRATSVGTTLRRQGTALRYRSCGHHELGGRPL